MTDPYIDELAAIRREQELPPALTDDKTFMSLWTVAQFGLTDVDREYQNALIALAYSKGRIDGGRTIANVTSIR